MKPLCECVSAVPFHNLILFFKLLFDVRGTYRKNNLLTRVFMCINIYITRTNVIFSTTLVGHVQIVYITEANDHIFCPAGRRVSCVCPRP